MKITTYPQSETKKCPFCAETIQVAAIKCRFCGEFLNGSHARNEQVGIETNSPSSEDMQVSDEVLYRGRPSILSIAGSLTRWLVILIAGGLLLYFPLESMSSDLLDLRLTQDQVLTFGRYRVLTGAGLVGIAAFFLLVKIIRLKSTCYEITANRIEWSRGVLSRKYDNLDMYKVVDLKLRRNFFDCITGVGMVTLVTRDKTDPEFEFEKMRRVRKLYNVIKKASLDAAIRSGVVHLEQD
jgi:hypothetical protein